MKETIIKATVIFLMFYIGTIMLVAVDCICAEITGIEGKLVLAVENIKNIN